jgi:hypothetical protein
LKIFVYDYVYKSTEGSHFLRLLEQSLTIKLRLLPTASFGTTPGLRTDNSSLPGEVACPSARYL